MKTRKDKVKGKIEAFNKIDRFKIILGVALFLVVALILRLGYLTIIRGSYYSDIATNNRIKEISVPAARGMIYDRNGKILAGTRSVFTASISVNDLTNREYEVKNESFRRLTRMFDQEGANYYENYPIVLNMYQFKDQETYFKENQSPMDKMVSILLEEDLMGEFIRKEYQEETHSGNYYYNVANQMIASLKNKGVYLPLYRDGKGSLRVKEGDEALRFMRDNGIAETEDPWTILYELVKKDEGVLRKTLLHPMGRALAYDIVKSKNLQDNIQITPLGLAAQEEYMINKARLNRNYSSITPTSEAKADFAHIVNESTLTALLSNITFDADNQPVVPAELALELLKKEGIRPGIIVEIDESDQNNPVVELSFEEGEEREDSSALNYLALLLRENNLVESFVTDDQIKGIAQQINTENNINPNISIVDWTYTSEKTIQELYDRFKVPEEGTVKDLYRNILNHYEIGNQYKYDAFNILMVYYRMENHTTGGYEPLHISYDLGERLTAQIKENFSGEDGISVSVKPVRFYPNGNVAAHALGYMGKISTSSEIETYVNQEKYNPEAIIGKTGIEESQEKILKGQNGVRRVYVDNRGNTTDILGESEPKPGNNVHLTIDLDLQEVAEEAMSKTLHSLQTGEAYESIWGSKLLSPRKDGTNFTYATSGSAVVLDVDSGEVLAMVNAPNFDPNLFSTGISQSDWASLIPDNEEDPLAPRPLYNMAIQSAIQPGSILKPSTSLAALEKGMDPDTKIKCDGYVTIGDREFGCWIWNTMRGYHGQEGVREALRDSCNYYYYSLALGENQGTGESLNAKIDINDLNQMSSKLGLGARTGIEIQIPRESNGILPDPLIKKQNTKVLFKHYLESNLPNYVKAEESLSPEEIEGHIETIVSWMDDETPLSRTEVINRLDEMGYEPEEIPEGKKQSLSDIIKFDFINQAGWTTADMMNVVIGQGQQAYTPLQMASFASVFANDGYKYKTTLIREVKDSNNQNILFENEAKGERIQLENYENLQVVREGMLMAAENGAEQVVFGNLPFDVGLKTGTAQVTGKNPTGEDYDEYGWMIAFAPYDDPKVAVATVVTQAGTSANVGPMTRDILAESLKIYPTNQNTIAQGEE